MDRVDDRLVRHAGRTNGVGVRRASSSGRSVIVSMKPSIARSLSSIGAVRQSDSTARQTSSPSAYDATAPCEPVQNGHWLSEETNAAKSSRSPGAPVGGPAHRQIERVRERAAEEVGPVVAGSSATPTGSTPRARGGSGRGRRPPAGAWPVVDDVEPHRSASSAASSRSARRRRGRDGLLEDLVLGVAGVLQRLGRRRRRSRTRGPRTLAR